MNGWTDEWLLQSGRDAEGRLPRNSRAEASRSSVGQSPRKEASGVKTLAAAGECPANIAYPIERPGTAREAPSQARDASPPLAPPRKYRNVPTPGLDVAGAAVRYDSRKEARVATELNSEASAGLIVSWVRQVSLPIGVDESGREVRIRLDALAVLEVNPDGTFLGRFADAKGRDTPNSRTKRAVLRERYGLDVKVI